MYWYSSGVQNYDTNWLYAVFRKLEHITGAGTFQSGGSTANPASIVWSDQKPNRVKVEAVVKIRSTNGGTCALPEVYTLSTFTTLRSVFGETLSGVLTPRDINYCDSNPVVIVTINPITVKNTGAVNQPPLAQMERYEWVIPAGWKQQTTGNAGTTYTTSPTISIVPSNPDGFCSEGGTLKVSAVASGFTSCSGFYSKSLQSSIQFRRIPTYSLTPQAGFTGQTCGRSATVTFTATSLPCVSSYEWEYPGNWTGLVMTSTNTVIATPANNGGDFTVKANTGVCKIKKTYTISYSPTVPIPSVYITNPYTEWCNYDPFTFTATPPAGYPTNFGFDWYATGGISINSVTNATASSPTHTTNNSVAVLVGGSVYGEQAVAVRMKNPSCESSYNGFLRKVGPYTNVDFSIIGPSAVCANQAADFRSSFLTSDVWGYQWSTPSGWFYSGQGSPYFSVSVPSPFYGGAITFRLQNRCGWTNTPYVLNLYSSCGFSYSASPNPASETIIVSDLDPEQETSAVIIDDKSKSQRTAIGKSGTLELDVRDLPNGLYILQLKQRNITETQQILVKH